MLTITNITKEKNLIHFNSTCAEKSYHYIFDINTGIMRNDQNRALKHFPKQIILNPESENLLSLFVRTLFFEGRTYEEATRDKELLTAQWLFVDKIMSLGYLHCDYHYFLVDTALFSFNVLNDNASLRFYHNHYSDGTVFNFQDYYHYILYKQLQLNTVGDFSHFRILAQANHQVCCFEKERVCQLFYYFEYYHLYKWAVNDATLYGLTHKFLEYFSQCKTLGITPVHKCNNILREISDTEANYNLWKEKRSTELFNKAYQHHSQAWNFSYGDFIVSIPQSGKDLIREGQSMHHCVGQYVQMVEEEKLYICFVRHKNTPDVPYITCEVSNKGKIGQYYLAYDRFISCDKDIKFKDEYQKYLNEVWGEG